MIHLPESPGLIESLSGQHNDARMNVSLIMTAVQHGATILNHVEVIELLKNEDTHKLNGARVRDRLTGEEINVRAKVCISVNFNFSESKRGFIIAKGSYKRYWTIH